MKNVSPIVAANIDRYLAYIKADYVRWHEMCMGGADDETSKKMIAEFTLLLDDGMKYIKVIQSSNGSSRSVHSFIEKSTGLIFKPAGWKAPTRNFSRGNVADATWPLVRWSGI